VTRAADLVEAAVEAAVEETLAYDAFPEEHWRRIRANNPLERILREIRRRTRVVGAFPDGQSALNLAAARLRHIAGTAWSTKRYLNIELLKDQQMRGAIMREPLPGCRAPLSPNQMCKESGHYHVVLLNVPKIGAICNTHDEPGHEHVSAVLAMRGKRDDLRN
jgi:hypothetical protein